ncbi:hypothetical protein BDW59DRAFT_160931 [Aspergillus cavernicola]|uniref:C6 zinc finger domain protein n=1 Tax=Aspergillus cavernicola TaxID=176166 RepID=A0ABR4IHQ9_9EURO
MAKQPKAPSGLRMVIYTPSGLTFPTTDAEKRSFDFFLAQSRDCFPLDFSQAILQAAQTDQAFSFAVVSLGAAQRIYEYEDNLAADRRLGDLAMQQYGKALQLLQGTTETRSIETFLMCCVLFASFESLRGCRKSAVIHIQSGLKLLRQSSPGKWSLVSPETIASIFTRLDNQLVELLGTSINETLDENRSNATTALAPIAPQSPNRDLYRSLDSLLNRIFHHQLDRALITEGRLDPDGFSMSHQHTCIELQQSHRMLAASMSPPNQLVHDTPDEADSEVLQIWNLLAQMYIAVWPGSGSEIVWDTFVHEFDTILALSEAYLLRTRNPTRRRTFGFSIGVIPPLYVTATRCREPRIRRRAIQLLAEHQRREVMWDSTHAAEAARQVMEMEELAASVPSPDGQGTRVKMVFAVFDDEDGVRYDFER